MTVHEHQAVEMLAKRLPRLLSYYGSKYNIASLYPSPKYDTIVEPFAGGASYALLHAKKNVLLVDKYEKAIAVWQYLIAASPDEIRALPLLEPGQSVDDLPITQEARWLIGWWCNCAAASPRKSLSSWARTTDKRHGAGRPRAEAWSTRCRERIARAVLRIKHWRAVCADYREADIGPATYFVDPPYQERGIHYPHGSKSIDFQALGEWCRGLSGQVMVCENAGADWLPFEPFSRSESMKKHQGRKSAEVLWCNDGWRVPQQQTLGDIIGRAQMSLGGLKP